ncbi:MAG: sterol desaturase family protein, partial [Nannocystaceae bacterium]
HHISPHDPEYWYTPMRGALIGFALVATLLWLALPSIQLWLTFVVTMLAVGLVYEWTHYLCHTSYRPRGRLYRRLWRLHRLHHFKNEHYWMGVTMHFADWVLGTLPSPRAVPTSPTCRDLLGRGETAKQSG